MDNPFAAEVKLCPLPPCACGGEQIAMVSGNTVVACLSCGRQLVLPAPEPVRFFRQPEAFGRIYDDVTSVEPQRAFVAMMRHGLITPLEARQIFGAPIVPPSKEEEDNLLLAIICGTFK